MYYIYAYDRHSESAKALAEALGWPRIKHEGSKFRGSLDKIVLNWGCSDLPRQIRQCGVLNTEYGVYNAVNKRRSLKILQGHVPTIPWVETAVEASLWLLEGSRVFARTKLTGKDGEGLVEHTLQAPVEAKLYTKFVQAEREYRVTVGPTGSVVAYQRKVPLDGFTGVHNPDIKTTAGGYGFKLVTRGIPPQVTQVAIDAVQTLGLDFGGVDVIWTGTEALVLEVNTAPQLTPAVCQALATNIKDFIDFID